MTEVLMSTESISYPEVPVYGPDTDITAVAMAYANTTGLYIGPTAKTGKHPGKNPGELLGNAWQLGTRTGGADAYAVFSEYPQACGVFLHVGKSGLVNFDLDTEDESIVDPLVLRAIHEEDPPGHTTRKDAVLRGHYLFRLPEGIKIGNGYGRLTLKGWGDIRGTNGVSILPGSWHPNEESGEYRCRKAGPIPLLPDYLIEALAKPDDGMDAEMASSEQVTAFLSKHVSELKPGWLKGPLTMFARRDGGTHPAMVSALCLAMREARAGLYPAKVGVDALRAELLKVRTQQGAPQLIYSQWPGLLSFAVGAALADSAERQEGIRIKALGGAETVVGADGVQTLKRNELPSPSAPAKVGRELVKRAPAVDGVPTLKWWQDEFYAWTGSRWSVKPASEFECWLYEQTEHAEYWTPPKDVPAEMVDGEVIESVIDREVDGEWKPWNPNIRKVAEVSNAMAKLILQHRGEDDRALACLNGVVDLETRGLLTHTPARFNLNSLPFNYDPAAECPRWLQFLDECLPGDVEAHQFIQEWFGYVLAGRTDQQKMASFVGKKRGGKGTIARTLEMLLGKDSVVATDITDLGNHFGRSSLVGRTLAVLSDTRWNSPMSTEALKTFLTVTGEDVITIPRKHKEDWTGRSGVRFMTLSNDPPQFSDRSNAIGSRMIHVLFRVTFEGREDFQLEQKLKAEASGILNWAIDGLHRLSERGRFTVPSSGQVISQKMEEHANPVRSFIENECEELAGGEIPAEMLLAAFNAWQSTQGVEKKMLMRFFLPELAELGFESKRRSLPGGKKGQFVYGLKAFPFLANSGQTGVV